MEENKEMVVQGFGGIQNTKTQKIISGTITDKKTLFNLETTVDFKLNDCVDEKIRVTDIVIKRYEKTLEEPIVNEETGEIKEKEIKIVTILIDDNRKSYVTGSKSFAFDIMKLGNLYSIEEIKAGIEIEIIKKEISNTSNKALSFKLL